MADEENPESTEQSETPDAVAEAPALPAQAQEAEAAGTGDAAQEAEAAGTGDAAQERPPVEAPQANAADTAAQPAEAHADVAAQPQQDDDDEEPAPREKPSVPGAHLEVDIVPEGVDPLGRGAEGYEDAYAVDPYALDEDVEEAEAAADEDAEEVLAQPISTAAIDLASGARYRATGKRKSAIARVTLRPGTGSYIVNGRTLEEHFPRLTLQRNIRQPLETVGYQERMDVVARLHGGGISAQAGALRHGVSRALLEADPNLRGELKRRGFLTRDSRAKERKKAGLKKARKRPQFSKR